MECHSLQIREKGDKEGGVPFLSSRDSVLTEKTVKEESFFLTSVMDSRDLERERKWTRRVDDRKKMMKS